MTVNDVLDKCFADGLKRPPKPRWWQTNYPELFILLEQTIAVCDVGFADAVHILARGHQARLCKVCGKQTKWNRAIKEFREYCSNKCVNADPDTVARRQETTKQRFGVVGTSSLPEIREKTRNTSLKKYGVECAAHSPEAQQHRKNTNIRKYGVEHVFQDDATKQKISQTVEKRYGGHHLAANEESRERLRQTNLERYGVEYQSQRDDVKIAIRDTVLEKYGVPNALLSDAAKEGYAKYCAERGVMHHTQLDSVKDAIKNTTFAKHGVAHHTQLEIVKDAIRATNQSIRGVNSWTQTHLTEEGKRCSNDDRYFEQLYNEHSFYDLMNITGYSSSALYRKSFDLGLRDKDRNISKGELEVKDFIESLGLKIEWRNRSIISPQEIDIWIPEKKIGIEYCGLYWHSEKFREKSYHQSKLNRFSPYGQLITMFENEWIDRNHAVKSRLKSLLGMNETRGARHYTVEPISFQNSRAFLERHHLQGAAPSSSTGVALCYDNEPRAVMTFLHRHSGEWELNRFASMDQIPGGAGRLLKYFTSTQDWHTIISFADLRWSTGDLYNKLGFYIDKILPPDYYYTKNGMLEHKFNHRKKRYTQEYDTTLLTEREIMRSEGWHRIYDCGKIRFKKVKTCRIIK